MSQLNKKALLVKIRRRSPGLQQKMEERDLQVPKKKGGERKDLTVRRGDITKKEEVATYRNTRPGMPTTRDYRNVIKKNTIRLQIAKNFCLARDI